jgi:hypothetical protein
MADEGVVRTDLGGVIDTDGNHAPDGVVGPYHQREGSADTVRAIWSPVQVPLETLPATFTGQLPVENRFSFRSLSDLEFEWALLEFSGPGRPAETRVVARGHTPGPPIAPATTGVLNLSLPGGWREADALRLIAFDPTQGEVVRWVWPLRGRSQMLQTFFETGPVSQEVALVDGEDICVRSGKAEFRFSKQSGLLESVVIDGEAVGLADGPRLVAARADGNEVPGLGIPTVLAATEAGRAIVEATDSAGLTQFRWEVLPKGVLRLTYRAKVPDGDYHYAGIGFGLQDQTVDSKRWLGGGPFRVWKNRMRGPTFGLWANDDNNGVAGEVWDLPEFKGIFKDVVWMRLALGERFVTIGLPEGQPLLGLLNPPNGADPKHCTFEYPTGEGIYVFEAIPAIGNKFHPAKDVGPSSEPTWISGTLQGTVLLKFE